jgi:hypothetical protein
MMEENVDRIRRRRVALATAPLQAGRASRVQRPRARPPAARPAPLDPRPANRSVARSARMPVWRPPLRLVASNPTLQRTADRAPPTLRLVPPSPGPRVSPWNAPAAMAVGDLYGEGRGRRTQAFLLATLAAAGLAALASSLGRLLGG